MCEAVHDLKKSLKGRSSDLIVRFGKPEQVVANFVRAFQAQGDNIKGVYLQKEVGHAVPRRRAGLSTAAGLFRRGSMRRSAGSGFGAFECAPHLFPTKHPRWASLERLCAMSDVRAVHPDDLPFSIEELPDVFTPFRKRVEGLQDRMARPVLDTPDKFKPCPQVPDTGDYGAQHEQMDAKALYSVLIKPLAGHIQLESDSHDTKSAFPFPGGETSALQRLDWYFKTGGSPPPAARYKQTRNHLLGHGYSTKMSPFLCLGSVSPRRIIQYLLEHEKEFGSSQNTYWVQFELLWRDYFLLAAQKYGDQLFKLDGFEAITDPKQARSKILGWNDWNPKDPKIRAWLEGRTGVPFIDANMVELIQSGCVGMSALKSRIPDAWRAAS
jgi:deoxyribodipyrimidine photo-lyase